VRRFPTRPSQRDVRNTLEWLSGGTEMEQSVKRGRQPEGFVNDEIAAWRNRQPNLLLERNKRRIATPPGMSEPIMLGWLADGSGDWLGHESVEITAAMVGKRVAVAFYVETKTKDGVLSDAQKTFIKNAIEAGAIAGVARSRADCDEIRARWLERMAT
jgi:hypothetical protein